MKNKLYSVAPLLVIMLVAGVLVTIWFAKGQVIGSGESGLPFVTYATLFPRNNFAWTESLLGGNTNQAGNIFFGFINIMAKIGLPNFLIQALFYWIMLVIGAFSVYQLSGFLIANRFARCVSGLFYILNMFTMVSVVNRLQYPFLYFFAVLPLGLFVFIKGLSTKKLSYALYFALCSLPFSLAFGSFPFIEIWWLVMGLYVVSHLILNRFSVKEVVFATAYLGLSLLAWSLVHLWWLAPLIYSTFSTPYPTSEAVTQAGNFLAFNSLSRLVGGLPSVLSLIDSSFLISISSQWGNFYLWPIARLLMPVPFFIILFGLVGKKPKNSYWFFVIVLFTLSVFFSKGSMPPFEEVFPFLVNNLRILEVFRNSFEKLGFILNLTYALLFGNGLFLLSKRHFKLALVFFVTSCIFLVYPMWTGSVFGGNLISVPDYYSKLNVWLGARHNLLRLAVFPLSGEGMTYNWGYNGVELSSELLKLPAISFRTSVPYLEDIISSLDQGISSFPTKLPLLLGKLGIQTVLVRHDVLYKNRQIRNPDTVNSTLDLLPTLTKSTSIGPIDVYSLVNSKSANPLFFATTQLIESYPQQEFSDNLLIDPDPQEVLVNPDLTQSELKPEFTLIKPIKDFTLPSMATKSYEESLAVLPSIKHLPGSKIFPLVRLKEDVQRYTQSQEQISITRYDIMLLGKRLAELVALVKLGSPEISKAVLSYQAKLNQIVVADNIGLKSLPTDEKVTIFSDHLKIIQRLSDLGSDDRYGLKSLHQLMSKQLAKFGLASIFQPNLQFSKAETRIVRFNVPKEDSYTLSVKISPIEASLYNWPGSNLRFQVDDLFNVIHPNINSQDDTMSLGMFWLDKGEHEVILAMPESINLVSGEELFSLASSQPATVLDVAPLVPGSRLTLKMSYLIEKGERFESRFVQDIDNEETRENYSYSHSNIRKDKYEHGWQNFETELGVYAGATTGQLKLIAFPFNFCPQSKIKLLDNCDKKSYSSKFDKTTLVNVTNLTVTRQFTNQLFLTTQSSSKHPTAPDITTTKVNPAKYILDIKNATSPFVLVMNQIYHPGWTAEIENEPLPLSHMLVDGYANGWEIAKKGNYRLILTFIPQTILAQSRAISLLAFSTIVLVVLINTYVRKTK